MNSLKEYLEKLNIEINDRQEEQFVQYMNLLVEWNEKMNLTAITEREQVFIKHFADSLTPLMYFDFKGKSVIDVGTGAGFPGLPLKIAEPTIELTLLDALQKRIGFLETVGQDLELENVHYIHARAEEGSRMPEHREQYDIAVSRAVASLNVLSEYDLPYVKVGGKFIALKGPTAYDEIKEGEKVVEILGGEITSVKEVTLPQTDITHTIVEITKIKSTDEKYPRRAKKISSSPL